MQERNKRARNAYRTGKRLPKTANGDIQLLLIRSVDSLGKQGEVVDVKPGYAKNYLIPQGLATIATDHHRRMVEKNKAQLIEIRKQRLAELRDTAALLAAKSITIEANANAEGRLYGSIGAEEIVQALKADNIVLELDQIRLEGPLKEMGGYKVRVYLGQEIETILSVWVVPAATPEA